MVVIESTEKTAKFNQIPTGVHKARCYMLLDLGTRQEEWNGEISHKEKVLVSWELPERLKENNEPETISKWYTKSTYEGANIVKDLVSWRGKPFTEAEQKKFVLDNIVGKPCLINVTHQKTGKAKVSAVMGIPSGTKIAEQMMTTMLFDLKEYQNGNTEKFNALPEWCRKEILKCEELQNIEEDSHEANVPDDDENEVPF